MKNIKILLVGLIMMASHQLLYCSEQPSSREIAQFLIDITTAQAIFNTPEEKSIEGKTEQIEQIKEFFKYQLHRDPSQEEIDDVHAYMTHDEEIDDEEIEDVTQTR